MDVGFGWTAAGKGDSGLGDGGVRGAFRGGVVGGLGRMPAAIILSTVDKRFAICWHEDGITSCSGEGRGGGKIEER